jgi:hypothetical protein
MWDYIGECLRRLAKLATRSDEAGLQARVGVGHKFRTLVSQGCIDLVEELVETVTSASGQVNPVELRLPLLGSIGGVVKDMNGNPVAGNYLKVTSTINTGFSRSLNTYNGSNGGAVGTFTFHSLPADTYLVEVRNKTNSSVVYRFIVTLAAGDAVSRDFRYGLSGSITGKVSYKTQLPGYYPSYLGVEVRDAVSKQLVTSTTTSNTGQFSTGQFAAPESGRQYEVRTLLGYSGKTAEAVQLIPAFTADGQTIDVGTLALPVESCLVNVLVKDANQAYFSKQVKVELLEPDGTLPDAIAPSVFAAWQSFA